MDQNSSSTTSGVVPSAPTTATTTNNSMTPTTNGNNNVDGVMVYGCVIRGETAHFDYVCNGVMNGINSLSLTTSVPITSAVVTANTKDQAIVRASHDGKNIGAHAMKALLELIHIKKAIS